MRLRTAVIVSFASIGVIRGQQLSRQASEILAKLHAYENHNSSILNLIRDHLRWGFAKRARGQPTA